MEVAWIGTGIMGAPMARRLLQAGHRVRVFNRSPEKARALARMTDESITEPVHLHQHRVVVAIDEDVDDFQAVAGCLAFHPELVARPAEEGREAAAPCLGVSVVDGFGKSGQDYEY